MTEGPAHKPRDARAARRALLDELEALREALDVTHDGGDGHADVPILEDVIGDAAPAPTPIEPPPPLEPTEEWRADADRLMNEARRRIAHLRVEAAQGSLRQPDAQQRARLMSELAVWLHERIDTELADLRLRLTSELEAELKGAVDTLFRGPKRQ